MVTESSWQNRADLPELVGLCEIGADFHRRGWSLGTSSNFSVVLQRDPLLLLLTGSGKDKSCLTPEDFVVVDDTGTVLFGEPNRPSAEMWLHLVLAKNGAGAVLHTHSVWATVLSDAVGKKGLLLESYEMLKGLKGIETHATSKRVAVFENTQDIPELAKDVDVCLHAPDPLTHGFLLRKHGLYAWGEDLKEARRHVEVFEFLFECSGREATARKASLDRA